MTAPSYDDFKNLVAAAHQKPVDQKDMQVLQGAAVRQFPPIHNKAATTVRTSGARSGLGRRRRTPGGSTAAATPTPTPSSITSLRTFQSEWGKCANAAQRQSLLRAVTPRDWQSWASSNAAALDSTCMASILQEAAELDVTLCVAWAVACVSCFPAPQLAVWGGTLTPPQAAAAKACLLQAEHAASGEDKNVLRSAVEVLHWERSG